MEADKYLQSSRGAWNPCRGEIASTKIPLSLSTPRQKNSSTDVVMWHEKNAEEGVPEWRWYRG